MFKQVLKKKISVVSIQLESEHQYTILIMKVKHSFFLFFFFVVNIENMQIYFQCIVLGFTKSLVNKGVKTNHKDTQDHMIINS